MDIYSISSVLENDGCHIGKNVCYVQVPALKHKDYRFKGKGFGGEDSFQQFCHDASLPAEEIIKVTCSEELEKLFVFENSEKRVLFGGSDLLLETEENYEIIKPLLYRYKIGIEISLTKRKIEWMLENIDKFKGFRYVKFILLRNENYSSCIDKLTELFDKTGFIKSLKFEIRFSLFDTGQDFQMLDFFIKSFPQHKEKFYVVSCNYSILGAPKNLSVCWHICLKKGVRYSPQLMVETFGVRGFFLLVKNKHFKSIKI